MFILEKSTELYNSNIPFVIFKRPNSENVELFHQADNQLYTFDNSFAVEGFILAPFLNNREQSVILKADKKYQSKYNPSSINFPEKKEVPTNNTGKEAHIQLVTKAIEELKKGTFEKVVLSRKITFEHPTNPITSFEKMIERYPLAFCYLFFHPKVGIWLAATPEKLLNVSDNQIYTMALAGTQPFREEGNYIWTEKEKDEQQIVTNVIVHRIHSLVEELNVTQPKTVRAGSVVHLCTDISARLREGENPFVIVNKLHPTPAICGFPNDVAKQFIIENEHYDRSYYSGYCGIVQPETSSIDFYVNLRCMQMKDNQVIIYVGGGILKESNPESEWEETQNKAQTMLSVL
ncbi:MAG: isochorismate synthase [Capnocytophaga sp.]|nr:isochorismate synthase [Capnocytophaga sp.]